MLEHRNREESHGQSPLTVLNRHIPFREPAHCKLGHISEWFMDQSFPLDP